MTHNIEKQFKYIRFLLFGGGVGGNGPQGPGAVPAFPRPPYNFKVGGSGGSRYIHASECNELLVPKRAKNVVALAPTLAGRGCLRQDDDKL